MEPIRSFLMNQHVFLFFFRHIVTEQSVDRVDDKLKFVLPLAATNATMENMTFLKFPILPTYSIKNPQKLAKWVKNKLTLFFGMIFLFPTYFTHNILQKVICIEIHHFW